MFHGTVCIVENYRYKVIFEAVKQRYREKKNFINTTFYIEIFRKLLS